MSSLHLASKRVHLKVVRYLCDANGGKRSDSAKQFPTEFTASLALQMCRLVPCSVAVGPVAPCVSASGYDADDLDGILFIFNDGNANPQTRLEVEAEELVFTSTRTKVVSYNRGGNQICLLDVVSQRYDMLRCPAGVHALAFTASGDEMVLAQVNGVLLVAGISGEVKLQFPSFG